MKSFLKSLIPKRVKESLAYFPGKEFSSISFSQEGEDMLLHRIFERQEKGLYVDIGAHHPFRFSNTYKLYQRGWTGLCIDPNPDVKKIFNEYRPKDVFLEMGVASQEQKLRYYRYKHPANNTCDEELVKQRQRVKPVDAIEIEVKPLRDLLPSLLAPAQTIDLMSIDVEGFDYDVLTSNDWDVFHPEWLVVECAHESIDDLIKSDIHNYLVTKDYKLVSKLYKSCFYKRC